VTTRLAGLAEVAEILQVTKRTASRYTRRADFPKAIEDLASGPVWARSDVERWAKRALPLRTGRPPRNAPQQKKRS